MTMPDERTRAVLRTEQFLRALSDSTKSPGVPEDIPEQARTLLRYFPSAADLAIAAAYCPQLFGDPYASPQPPAPPSGNPCWAASSPVGMNEPSLPPQFDVVEVQALPDYSLRVTFENAEVRIFEMSSLLARASGVFAPLRERELFDRAFVASGTVCWPGEIELGPEMVYRQSVPESGDTRRRIGIAKGVFDVPDEQSYPRDPSWEAMPEVGLEVWPAYSSDTAAWAMDQAQALRNRAVERLDWDHVAEEMLDLAKAERRELGRCVSGLMVTLAKQAGCGEPAGPADARLIREQRKLVLLHLAESPSLEKYLSDPRWLSHCWSDAVVVLGAAGVPVEGLPEDCPWDKSALLG